MTIRFVVSLLTALLLTGLLPATASAAAIQANATVRESPPRISLNWPGSIGYSIYRKTLEASSWGGTYATGTGTGFDDDNVAVGVGYEYKVTFGSDIGYI